MGHGAGASAKPCHGARGVCWRCACCGKRVGANPCKTGCCNGGVTCEKLKRLRKRLRKHLLGRDN
eukprot:2141693-Lingulodinium_polyedra.AAC.1